MLSLLFLPELLPGLAELAQRPPKLPIGVHLKTVYQSTLRRLTKITLWLTFLPFEAVIALDAIVRSLWRMFYSRQRLLQWQTAAATERAAVAGLWHIVRRMWVAPGLATVVSTVLIAGRAQQACLLCESDSAALVSVAAGSVVGESTAATGFDTSRR